MKKGRKLAKFLVIALPTLALLTSCTEEDIQVLRDNLNSIGDKIIPNIWAFLVQLLALVVMIVLVIILAYKPVHKFLAARKEYLNNQVKETARLNEESKKYNEESKLQINEAKNQANMIVKEAVDKANERSTEIISEAQKEAADIKEKSLEEIAKAKEQAMSDLSDQIVDVALSASSKILEREVNEEDNKKIVDSFVKDLKKEN